MVADDADRSADLELDGVLPNVATNDEVPISREEREKAVEYVQRHVDRERKAERRRQAARPETEYLELELEFQELVVERLAEELGLTEEYDELRTKRESIASDISIIEDGDTSTSEGDSR